MARTIIHLDRKSAPEAVRLALAAFPDYRGNKFAINITDGPMQLDSYWDGGSRTSYRFIRLDNLESVAYPSNHPVFDPKMDRELKRIPDGVAVVAHSIFQGRDAGLTIYIHPDNANQEMLPAPDQLSWEEKIVLIATRGLKNSYAGETDVRFKTANREAGITKAEWETAKDNLIKRGLLNRAGSITTSGKNAVGDLGYGGLHSFKRPSNS